jgi:hypothetical protein
MTSALLPSTVTLGSADRSRGLAVLLPSLSCPGPALDQGISWPGPERRARLGFVRALPGMHSMPLLGDESMMTSLHSIGLDKAVGQRGKGTKGQGAGGGRGQGGFNATAPAPGTGQAVGMLNSSSAVEGRRRAVEGLRRALEGRPLRRAVEGRRALEGRRAVEERRAVPSLPLIRLAWTLDL